MSAHRSTVGANPAGVCPHPAHREHGLDWRGDSGKVFCGVCVPKPTPLEPEIVALIEADPSSSAADADESAALNGHRPSTAARERRPLDLDPDAEPVPPNYLLDGRIERGTITALAGDTGAAKSFTVQSLVIATVERRTEWLGRTLKVGEGRVLVIDEENPERLVNGRLRALGLTSVNKDRLRYFHQQGVRLGDPESDEWLRAELVRETADLMVIDTATAATAVDLLDNAEVTALYRDTLRPLAAEFDLPIILLLHERKPGAGGSLGPATMRSLGARAWIQQADNQLILARSGEGREQAEPDGTITLETRFSLTIGKLRDGGSERRETLTVASTLSADRALLTAEVTNQEIVAATPNTADEIRQLLTATPGLTKADLEASTGKGQRTIGEALKALEATDSGTRPKRFYLPEGHQGELAE